MKKPSIILILSISMCLLAACGSETLSSGLSSSEISSSEMPSSETYLSELTSNETHSDESASSKSSQSAAESTRTDVLYAVFSGNDVKKYPIEYAGEKKTAKELADELTKLTGLDFTITASETNDGWRVDWDANSSLFTGPKGEQKEDFFFFDYDSSCWFMMDTLWTTLTKNLGTENIYYTMNGGQELVLQKMSPSMTIPSDTPYMGSEFYFAHADVKGSDVEIDYTCTKGLWRMDGATDTASIEMDGLGGFTMYYAGGAVEAAGHLECTDEYGNGDFRYDMYTAEGELIAGFYFDSDTQFHIGNDDELVYILDTQEDMQEDMQALFQGSWEYPDGTILEINGEKWNCYESGESAPFAWGPVEYDKETAYLMNEDGSSGGGKVYFDENGALHDVGGDVLTRRS